MRLYWGSLDEVQLPNVTISIGVAQFKPGFEFETMIAAADVAMYHAKRDGRNCVKAASDT